jgi:hypothetical protein
MQAIPTASSASVAMPGRIEPGARHDAPRPRKMKFVRDHSGRGVFGQKCFRIFNVLRGIPRGVFDPQPRRVCAVRRHIIIHYMALGHDLVIPLPTAKDEHRIARFHQVKRGVEPRAQGRRRLIIMDARAEH